MKTVIIFQGILCSIFVVTSVSNTTWSWKCNENIKKCIRIPSNWTINENCEIQQGNMIFPSVATCRLICGKYGALWPKPTGKVSISEEFVHIHPSEITFYCHEIGSEFFQSNANIFKSNLHRECGGQCIKTSVIPLHINIRVLSESDALNWETNEKYSLKVSLKHVKENEKKISGRSKIIEVDIEAATIYGARHALETLTQLVASYKVNAPHCDGSTRLVMVKEASVVDGPIYPHRGLLIDTARNFLSVEAIKKQIDGMASCKMNVLHWHATDSQSFPLYLPKLPQLSKFGSYSPEMVYKPSEIRQLAHYAKTRGVQIIIEIDAPSHAGNGWQWGPEENYGNLSVCLNKMPWRSYCIQPPCGQLNPINENLYPILGNLYSDIIELLPDNVFHMGGDEVFFPCWNSTDEIISYLKNKGKGRNTEDFLDLWGYYQSNALKAYDEQSENLNNKIILWSSHLTQPEVIKKYLSKDRYVIQTWVPSGEDLPEKLLRLGYKIIISTKDAWYLDHGFWGSTKYHNWQTIYENKIQRHKNVLGGEVCMWGEYVEDYSVDAKIWPRTAALAERLWSDPKSSYKDATTRFLRHRERLISRNLLADAEVPRWCYQNEGECV